MNRCIMQQEEESSNSEVGDIWLLAYTHANIHNLYAPGSQ